MKTVVIIIISFLTTLAHSQSIHPDIVSKQWNAHWITVPGEPANDYGVYNFRKVIDLPAQPDSFIVHVSGDNRYKLYINNALVSHGPARGDVFHWNFETIDIAPFLTAGKNCISAVVWNFGDNRPEAQVSWRTAFILQGNTAREESINTNNTWRCMRDARYQPLHPALLYTYYVSGPGEAVDNRIHPGDWQHASFDDTEWEKAHHLSKGLPKGVFDYSNDWMLVPRKIPAMELTPQRLKTARRSVNLSLPKDFPATKKRITIPPHQQVSFLLDQGFLTNAYPVLMFSQGRDASISMSYAEALYIDEGPGDWRSQNKKGNRNDITNKRFVGVRDQIISNGDTQQTYTPLWWRTYRYLNVNIETKAEELVIDDLYGLFTGYPFSFNASFHSPDPELTTILETGWRTARLCAHETYFDCPYYEQLQYIGDTRIQALVSLYNSGDDRLMRNAITQMDQSRMAEGITLSRYPTAHAQQIPPFSLWWIGMVHDYWMYRPDSAFVKSFLPGMRQVLHWYDGFQQDDGLLVHPHYWNFTDWATGEGWSRGVPPMDSSGHAAILDLQLLWAYQLASELEGTMGYQYQGELYKKKATQLKQSIHDAYWDDNRKLFADTKDKTIFSQHTSTLAVLTEVITGDDAQQLMKRVLLDTTLTQATIYFKYYVHLAAAKVGLGNQYLTWLGDWRDQLQNGLTTWAEISNHTASRSDCHAWGSSPNIEFFRTVLGIDSDAPGFRQVKIQPHLGDLKEASGKIPHPNGEVSVRYVFRKKKWNVEIELPPHTPGRLIWSDHEYNLKAGQTNLFTF